MYFVLFFLYFWFLSSNTKKKHKPKTSVIRQMVEKEFSPMTTPTLGASFGVHSFLLKDRGIIAIFLFLFVFVCFCNFFLFFCFLFCCFFVACYMHVSFYRKNETKHKKAMLNLRYGTQGDMKDIFRYCLFIGEVVLLYL